MATFASKTSKQVKQMVRLTRAAIVAAALSWSVAGSAADFVNITPKPLKVTTAAGTVSLPGSFTVSADGLGEDEAAEAGKFAASLQAAGIDASVGAASGAFVRMQAGGVSMAEEGYSLDVKPEGITVKAVSPEGFFYAFQTLKKLLPANVMAGVPGTGTYSLPVITVDDEPRFAYRGFMLDVARHFFSAAEVKKMLKVMAAYKMNKFHWHLSDDQGWRVEIKKYPKLTTVGATASNCYVTDLQYGAYWTNAQYGPLYYTQEEIRDVVEYAKELHIDIIPEIDMPGHFIAALASYPEYSCTPQAKREPMTWGGVYSDVLNVGDPKAVQFAKDIISEIIDLFPGEQINIGGDECPTSAWEGNAQCREAYAKLGLTNYRQLQSHFIKEMADFIASKGRKTSVWNEAISAGGADLDLIKATGATVYCWTGPQPAARKAAEMGLDNIITPWGPYYINRKQSSAWFEQTLPGDGSDNLKATYEYVPVPADVPANLAKHYIGVQGTFWTEHVADTAMMEYLAMPRLFAVAEAGWTQQSAKNYADFTKRIAADTTFLNLAGYGYCRADIAQATATMVNPTPSVYYRMTTRATDNSRKGRCIELLSASSPLVSEYGGKGAAANVLWTNAQAENGASNEAAQMWKFEADPSGSGLYALVCKASPAGSVNPQPTQSSTGGRWKYDTAKKNYSFKMGEKGYGKDGNNYYYSIGSTNTSGWYVNSSLGGQGFAVNLYQNPSDGNSGLWTLIPAVSESEVALSAQLAAIKDLLSVANVYEGAEKKPGAYGKAERDALVAYIEANAEKVDGTEEEAAAFKDGLEELSAAFKASFGYLEKGMSYRFRNTAQAFSGMYLSHGGINDKNPGYSADGEATVWIVADATVKADGSQTVKLQNAKTKKYIYSSSGGEQGKIGWPVEMAFSKADVTVVFNAADHDYTLSVGGHKLFPVPQTSAIYPGIISGMSNPVKPQGGRWVVEPVAVETGLAAAPKTTAGVERAYDLQGRPVANPASGLYIVGNKKVVVK